MFRRTSLRNGAANDCVDVTPNASSRNSFIPDPGLQPIQLVPVALYQGLET